MGEEIAEVAVAGEDVGPEAVQSIWSLVAESGPVVTFVLVLLLVMSVLCWAVILLKWFEIRRVRRRGGTFVQVFRSADTLGAIYEESKKKKFQGALEVQVFQAGYRELRLLSGARGSPSRKALVEAVAVVGLATVERGLEAATQEGLHRLERFLGILATTASAAPFIGLFGTVWGIMNAFRSLGIGGASTIEVVAQPIAEALVATAAGLAAAIPAAIFYNVFTNQIRATLGSIDRFRADFLNLAQLQVLQDSDSD